jgi:transcriptional regulator of acetoin/glycerol metabolism
MIREVCSCGAEIETDEHDAVILVKSWRRSHKHAEKPPETPTSPFQVTSDSQVALGFQALYDPLEGEIDDGNK